MTIYLFYRGFNPGSFFTVQLALIYTTLYLNCIGETLWHSNEIYFLEQFAFPLWGTSKAGWSSGGSQSSFIFHSLVLFFTVQFYFSTILVAQPNTDAERYALKFLQHYIRGLDNGKLIQFPRFTTASDVLITNKLEVTFTKFEGAACRPIALTCGPLLELPSTYSNFVELREQFNNILEKDMWEMDIM